MQPRHQATLTQPLQCDLQRLSCKTQKNYVQQRQQLQLQNRISTPKQKKDDFEAFCKRIKGFLKGQLLAPKLRKSADKSLSQPGCSHSNTIYDVQLQKTIVLRMQPRHRATLTQPLQCDLQRLSCKTQKNYAQQRRLIAAPKADFDATATKRRFCSTIEKNFYKEKY